MFDDEMAANAVDTAEDYSADVDTDVGLAADDYDNEDNEPVAEPAGQQDVTTTQAFSRRLRERTDNEIASAGLSNPFTGQPIRTSDDLRAYATMMQAEAAGRDPQAAATEAELRNRLAYYEDAEQAQAVRDNPMLSRYSDEFADDVEAIIATARAEGRSVSRVDALKACIMANWDSVAEREAARVREETIKHYNAQAHASPGSLGGAATHDTVDYATMSSEDFNAVVEKALRGELKK